MLGRSAGANGVLARRPRSRHGRFGVAVVAAALLAAALPAAGCSRLSGGHGSDGHGSEEEDAESARVDRLLDDAPESLKAKRSTAAVDGDGDKAGPGSVVVDATGDVSTKDQGADRPVLDSGTSRPKSASTAARRQASKKAAPRSSVDEIPDAADIGL